MPLEVRVLRGHELAAALPQVAALRIEVFRKWPYLYDGDPAYEEQYLHPYLKADRSVLVGAFAGETLVGASTALPLVDHNDDFSAAFSQTSIDVNDVFYCAESVLLPAYRGVGIGHRFFDLREEAARAFGFGTSAFCAVMRNKAHPARPEHYRSLEPFWQSRGYTVLDRAIARFSWKDVADQVETSKPLQFWSKQL